MSGKDIIHIAERIDRLTQKIVALGQRATSAEQRDRSRYAGNYIERMTGMLAAEELIFGVEPWHALEENLPLKSAGELLLRVKDEKGAFMAPYPAVMTFYHNGFTEDLDTILALCALEQFRKTPDRQISINISCRSLKSPEFLKAILLKIELLRLSGDERIIFEVHESSVALKVSDKTASLFKRFNVDFALDDVSPSMSDVFRLSAFSNIASYIKLDHEGVIAAQKNPKSLSHTISLVHSLLPEAHMVAEGVQSAAHAAELLQIYPDLKYVQGLHLPDRAAFSAAWKELKAH